MAHSTTARSPFQHVAALQHDYRAGRRAFIRRFVAGLQSPGVPALSLWRHTQAAWLADRHGANCEGRSGHYGHLVISPYTAPSVGDPVEPLLPRITCNLITPGPSQRVLKCLGLLPACAHPTPWHLEFTSTIQELPRLAPWVVSLALTYAGFQRSPGPLPVAMDWPVNRSADLEAIATPYLWTLAAHRIYAAWERSRRRRRPAAVGASY